MSVRAHLEAAQLALMEAEAQARIDQERAIFNVATTGQYRPVVRTTATATTIGNLLQAVNHLIQSQSNG